MKDIIPAVDKELIEKELTEDKFIRNTNNGGNKLFVITYKDSPNVMREIGRLRELAFREAGGGTGKEMDIDDYDLDEEPYKQLIVWDPEEREILGGYRYKIGNRDKRHNLKLATAKLFKFSENFKNNYLPHLIELGRSFVQPAYQSTGLNRKGLYALDNLWDGLGTITINYPHIKYFFGKVTMYRHYNKSARNLILYFLQNNFPDKEKLVTPFKPLKIRFNKEKFTSIFPGKSILEDYKILSQRIRALGENIPPLINAYMNLSPSMKTFGTVINANFGGVEETGLMISFKDMYKEKIDRHIASYRPNGNMP